MSIQLIYFALIALSHTAQRDSKQNAAWFHYAIPLWHYI